MTAGVTWYKSKQRWVVRAKLPGQNHRTYVGQTVTEEEGLALLAQHEQPDAQRAVFPAWCRVEPFIPTGPYPDCGLMAEFADRTCSE
jgi:hypothetical protein